MIMSMWVITVQKNTKRKWKISEMEKENQGLMAEYGIKFP